jgi:Zn-dependent protease
LDIAAIIQKTVLLAPAFLIAITFHELAHGFVAYKLGDPTAKMLGRLTFNPLKHLDPVGTLALIVTGMIGWAKPVPVNPHNLRNPKQDMMWVSFAGPATNFIFAIIAAMVFRVLAGLPISNIDFFGEKLFRPILLMTYLTVRINIGLGVFNLIPIPPLDGSTILMGLLPNKQALAYSKIERYGFFILLALIFLRVTDIVIYPIIRFLNDLLLPEFLYL